MGPAYENLTYAFDPENESQLETCGIDLARRTLRSLFNSIEYDVEERISALFLHAGDSNRAFTPKGNTHLVWVSGVVKRESEPRPIQGILRLLPPYTRERQTETAKRCANMLVGAVAGYYDKASSQILYWRRCPTIEVTLTPEALNFSISARIGVDDA